MGQEEFKDIKGVIRIRKSKNDRQCNCQNKKDKQRSTKHTHKTKDRVTRNRLKTGVNSGAPDQPLVTATKRYGELGRDEQISFWVSLANLHWYPVEWI
jgi:hypothetical protein